MNYEPQQIDAIVREVMRRLRALDPLLAQPCAVRPDTAQTRPSDSLHWEARLVTWSELAPRLKGHTRVTFPARVIVTPLVKDELTQRGIRWTCRDATSSPERGEDKRTLRLWGDDEPAQRDLAKLLTHQLVGSDLQVVSALGREPSEFEGPSHTLEILADSLGAESRAIVLSRRPYRSACVLNRHASLRAVVVAHAAHVRQINEELQANVLVFDIGRQSMAEILHGLRIYLRHWSNVPTGASRSRQRR